MTKEEHMERHKMLHKALDEIVADMICHTLKDLSHTTVMELIEWSHSQTINPTEKE